MNFETVIVGALETNCYLVYCPETHECAVVDPGAEAEKIFPLIAEKGLHPIVILNTHGHVDHIGANKDIKDRFNIPLSIHPSDSAMLESVHLLELGFLLGAKASPSADNFLKDGDKIKIGKSFLRVIHTPGHTPDSICLIIGNKILTGDTLFVGECGRTDLPGGNSGTLYDSLFGKIIKLDDDLEVYPGHDYGEKPDSTLEYEKKHNYVLKQRSKEEFLRFMRE